MSNNEQYYKNSIESLKQYIKETKIIPTEKMWNKKAIEEGLLTSQSLGYLSGTKFPDLCKTIYKQMQNKKK